MIHLKNLEVSYFRGIKSAKIQFSSGLNILHGDNELGKSSLVTAIRAALLLPSTSAEAREYQTWGTDRIPTVTLHFEVGGTSFQVRKEFATGSRGSATLHRMKGTELFHMAKARAVDGELRKLLAWGIPEPGGRGAPRGLPDSYLSKALLGFQEDVESILTADIEKDKTESGRQILTEALGALGQEPVVTSLLDRLHHRTSKVFTPSGQLKKTQDSPLSRRTREIALRERRLHDLEEQLQKSENVEESLRELSARAEVARARLEKAEAAHRLAKVAAAAELDLQSFADRKEQVDAARGEHEKAIACAQAVQTELDDAIDKHDNASKTAQASEVELAQLKSTLESLQKTNAATTEERRKAIDAELKTIANEMSRMKSLELLSEEVASLATQCEEAQTQHSELTSKKAQAQRQLQFARLSDQRNVILEWNERRKTATKDKEQVESKLEVASDELDATNARVAQAKRACELRVILDALQARRRDIELATGQTTNLRETIRRLEQQRSELAIERSNGQRSLDELNSGLASLRGEKKTLVDSATALAASRKKELESQLSAARQRVAQAENMVASSRELEQTRKRVESLQSEYLERQTLFNQSERILQHVMASEVIAEADKSRDKQDQISTEIAQLNSAISHLNEELADCDIRVAVIREELSASRLKRSKESSLRDEWNSIRSEKLACSTTQQEARSTVNELKQLQAAEGQVKTVSERRDDLGSQINTLLQDRDERSSEQNRFELTLGKERQFALGAVASSIVIGIGGIVLWLGKLLSIGVIVGPAFAAVLGAIAYRQWGRSKLTASEVARCKGELVSLDDDIREARTKLTVLTSQLETAKGDHERLRGTFDRPIAEMFQSAKSEFNRAKAQLSQIEKRERELKQQLQDLAREPIDSIPAKENELNQLDARKMAIREDLSAKRNEMQQKDIALQAIPHPDCEIEERSREFLIRSQSQLTDEEKRLEPTVAKSRREESADRLRQSEQALRVAEREVASQGERHRHLSLQLDGEADKVLVSAQQDVASAEVAVEGLSRQQASDVQELEANIAVKEIALRDTKKTTSGLQERYEAIEEELASAKEQLTREETVIEQLQQAIPQNAASSEDEFSRLTRDLSGVPNAAFDAEDLTSLQSLHETLAVALQDATSQLNRMRDEAARAKAALDKLREICPELGLAEIDGKIDDLRAEDPDHQLSNQPVPEAETRLANIEVESQKQKSRLEKLIGQEDAKASELAKQRAGIAQPVVAQLTGLKRQFQEKAAEKEDLQQDTTEKQEALSRKIAETESRLSSERESLRDKQKAKDELAQKYDHARKIWNEAEGRLRQLEKQTDASARKTAEAAIEGAVSESQGSLVEGKPFSKQLALLNDELKAARRVSKNCDKELQMSRGQLELIGGSVIRDQIKRERESLKKLQEDASDFEEQCNAEKYLLDALTGSNDKHSAHLGRMLADPVSSTFNKLTGNRYGTFSLEPTLTVKSVTADGNDRGYELLSVGTRHQLAVLVRLALSAHLQATLLLDDQLVHSDPKRLEWFRETLQESAKQYDHQIIVITCRPSDYGAPFNQNGATSSVDLSDLVERCSLNGNNY